MRILAFDTAADFCCVLLMEGNHLADQRMVMTARDQAKILAPLTQDILAAHGLSAHSIDRFAIATGPGSFTGLRVGLAFVRGLGLATKKPVIGLDHFQGAQRAIKNAGPLLVIRESKRAELFACPFDANGAMGAPFLATAGQLAENLRADTHTYVCGDGAPHIIQSAPDLTGRLLTLPPESSALSAARFAAEIKTPPGDAPQPFYLRAADVTMPKKHA